MNSPLDVGSIVADTYRITSPLGAGGMGSVFAAEHLRLPGKRVAIKVLHNTMTSEEILHRFRREAEITSRIGHPNIVEVLDFNHLPSGEPFLVMELLAGESLTARLKRGRLTERTALDIARQIGSALDAAHRLQVVHRDLKPDNIFLCPRDVDGELRDQVKVLDFGISKIRNSTTMLTQDAAVMGTPFYMSPEQASGKNQEVDGRTDIFALGAIVFEMLTGKTAFPGESVPAVIFQVVFQPHPTIASLVPTVSAKVAAAVDGALAKDPAARFQTMAAFVEALTGRPLMLTSAMPSVTTGTQAVDGLGATTAAVSGVGATAVAPGVAPAAMGATAVASAGVPPASAGYATGATVPPPQSPAAVPVVPIRSKAPWIVAMVAVVAAAGVAGTVLLRRAPEQPVVKQPPGAGEKTETVSDKRPAIVLDASPVMVSVPATATATATEKHVGGGKGGGKGAAREERLSPTLLADLEAAERALAAKDAAGAIRAANHSLYEKKTARAASILTRAHCLKHDLGAAKAELAHVAAADRGKVLKACRAAGLDL